MTILKRLSLFAGALIFGATSANAARVTGVLDGGFGDFDGISIAAGMLSPNSPNNPSAYKVNVSFASPVTYLSLGLFGHYDYYAFDNTTGEELYGNDSCCAGRLFAPFYSSIPINKFSFIFNPFEDFPVIQNNGFETRYYQYTLDFTEITTFGSYGGGEYDGVKFSVSVAAVPEPATWAMMISGFGLVGGSVRYRRRKTRFSHASA